MLKRLFSAAAAWALVGAAATACASAAPDALGPMVDNDLSFARSQLTRSLSEVPNGSYPDKTAAAGTWHTTGAGAWTSGFFPGSLWLMYQATGDASWRSAAADRQAAIESQKTNTSTHDIGFMLFDSFGNGYRLTGDTHYRDVALTAAGSLMTRYNATVGAIRSWNNSSSAPATDFQVIVDNMMNLELPLWASKHGGDPSWASEATNHALTTAAQHVRTDGSTYHLVVFDSSNGSVKSRRTHAGYSDSSTWARGQAWAVYGFTTVYRETGDSRFLATARRTADYFVSHLPADHVPYWDFNAPGIPNEPRDTSAAAIAASGLLELSRLEPDAANKQRYRAAAEAILRSLSAAPYLAQGTSSRSILLHGTSNKPAGDYDTGLIYGDYYFIEALLRYKALAEPGAAVLPPPPGVPQTPLPGHGKALVLTVPKRVGMRALLRRGLVARVRVGTKGRLIYSLSSRGRRTSGGRRTLSGPASFRLRLRMGAAARRRLGTARSTRLLVRAVLIEPSGARHAAVGRVTATR